MVSKSKFQVQRFRHGRFVARRPVLVILLSLAFTGLCATGLVNFHWESNAIKLWIPQDSDFAQDYDYLWSTHPPELRFHSIIFTTQNGDNILQPKYIRQMYKVRKKISGIRIQNRSWENHCFRFGVGTWMGHRFYNDYKRVAEFQW